MNTKIKVADLTQAQRENVILESGKTWDDVESVNYQLRKDGSVANYSVEYKTVQHNNNGVRLFNGLKAITKHGITRKAERYANNLNKKSGL